MEKALHRLKGKQESEGNIAATFAIEEAIRVMLDLGLCCSVQGKEDVYYVPSLIEELKPSAVWEKKPKLSFYRGRRYRVVNETTDESTYDKVKEVTEAVHSERVPGTPMDWCYVSSEELRDHKENVAVYKTIVLPLIENKRFNDRVRAEQSRGGSCPTCQVKDLLFPVTRDGQESTRFPDDGDKVCS